MSVFWFLFEQNIPRFMQCQCVHVTLCDSAGVMYWGDAVLHRIERANTDGSGRRTIRTETTARYYDFALHASSIYFTDWDLPYV